jgi:CMP-N-acetylneuraminic acid synthetase
LELAQDDTPVWDVIRHALAERERITGTVYQYVVLLEPTSPCRRPVWISEALKLLRETPHADGVHGISLTPFNPIWNCLVEKEGRLEYLVPQGRFYHRRQDVPPTYRMDGSLHVWRARFVRERDGGYHWGQHVGYKTDPRLACSIDTLEQFEELEEKVKKGVIKLAWM